MENGLITKGARLVIPSHIEKQGVGADTRRDTWALKNVCSKPEKQCFWPGISNDIREAVEKCGICQASSKSSKTDWKCE